MLICFGTNHQLTSSAQRAGCVIADEQLAAWYQCLQRAGATEALWLATCNRNELYLVVPDANTLDAVCLAITRAYPAMALLWADATGMTARDDAAARHLMRVAASLDAMVVGEPQILGQVKQAAAHATEYQMIGPTLRALLPQVLHVAKQVRTQTAIAESPVSISTIAVQLATQIFDSLRGRRVLVLGAGEMGTDAVRAFRAANVESMWIANRTPEKAQALADVFQADVCRWDDWPSRLDIADVVLSSIPADASSTPLLTRAQFSPLVAQRASRPLFVIDIAQPRGIDPDLANEPDVYLYGLDDLQSLAEANRAARAAAVSAADALIDRAMARYNHQATPPLSETTIRALHAKCEQIRLAECARTSARFADQPALREALDACTKAIVTKILHEPAMQLRQEATTDSDHPIHWLRRVFGLD